MVFCNLGGDTEYAEALKSLAEGKPYDFNLPEDFESVRAAEKKLASELGCQGESLLGAWQYLYRFGAIEESCVPYGGGYLPNSDLRSYTPDPDVPACADVLGNNYDICPNTGKPIIQHRIYAYYYVPGTAQAKKLTAQGSINDKSVSTISSRLVSEDNSKDIVATEKDIRREIYHWGPVTSGIITHTDFTSWDGKGVYKWDGSSAEDGGHAIVIVGWGFDTPDNVPYWMVRNSWGVEWGDSGYFKIYRGNNECGIEENVVVGVPDLPGYRLYVEHPFLFTDKDVVLRSVWNVADSGAKRTTYDSMLNGTLPPWFVDVDTDLYNSNYWPDLSTFIAGKPNKTVCRLNRPFVFRVFRPRNSLERSERNMFVFGVGAVIIAILVTYKFTKK
jgi:hypothetical protein